MNILIVTPVPPRSRKGNRITALRWAKLLRALGHRVSLSERFVRQRCDVLIALHALRSHASIRRFAEDRPCEPLIVALTGTDLYRDLPVASKARASLDRASRIVVLQPMAMRALPKKAWRNKARVIYQSATGVRHPPPPARRYFDVCVLGHLRPVKDPFRTALASRGLPSTSRIRIIHIGAALNRTMETRAYAETERNPRYRWFNNLPRHQAMLRLARSRLLVLSSRMEGGANALSEAIANSVPIIASRIDGSVGILGADYPGFFPVGDTRELIRLLSRTETDTRSYAQLKERCARLRPLVEPAREQSSWARLLSELA